MDLEKAAAQIDRFYDGKSLTQIPEAFKCGRCDYAAICPAMEV